MMSTNVTLTLNGTQPMSSCFNPTEERIGKTIIYCLIFVVSLVGNGFIGIIVYKTKALRKPINFFIVNMAMSDLLFTIFLIPKQLEGLYTTGSWLISGSLGKTMCKLLTFSVEVSNIISIQSLCLIAVDRFGAVFYPLRCPLISSKRCRFFIPVTWIIALAFNCPQLIAYRLVQYPKRLVCEPKWNGAFGESSSYKNYVLARSAVFWQIPLVLIVVLYIAILKKVKSQKIPGEQCLNTREQRARRERNVLKMSVAIMMTFAVCWLPVSISELLHHHSSRTNTMIWSCAFQIFRVVAKFLGYSNCAINPCICFIFSENYRQGLKNLLRWAVV
ncbi:RYamide receptor-like [Stylophora pistillata]|uniref:RYamide receptor-like n=1 Tax=Stylophora pistillata TaxID=50429 RepID=UPI000C0418AF|nr:RYamide receptor-like [Stylophora pistillata]